MGGNLGQCGTEDGFLQEIWSVLNVLVLVLGVEGFLILCHPRWKWKLAAKLSFL